MGPPVIALDAGGASLQGLLSAVGVAFVLGAPVQIEALFNDRFVRSFDFDRPRRFFANPCEAAPSFPTSQRSKLAASVTPAPTTSGDRRTPLEIVRALVTKRLDVAADAIQPQHRLLGDLHLNSIAVGQVVAEA